MYVLREPTWHCTNVYSLGMSDDASSEIYSL